MPIDVIDCAKALIACPSVTPQPAGSFDYLQELLTGMGFSIWRETFHEDGFEATENFYARLGNAVPNLCFAGHVDVVPPGDLAAWTHPPFEPTIDDGLLYGRGAEDMKGAIAAFIAATSRYLEEGEPSGSISFLLTADEEGIAINGTRKMLAWLEEKGERLDACIVGEPTNPENLGEMIKVGRRGSLLCELIVRGKQGHVAYPDKADNPITALVAMLAALKAEPIDQGTEFFPPSHLEITSVDVGNMVENLIPRKASARFNIRFNDIFDGASLEEWIRGKLDGVAVGPFVHYELHCRISGESFLTENTHLAELFIAANQRVLGKTPVLSTTGGTSDARFIKDYCPVIEYGTTGPTAHQIDECVSVDTLHNLTHIYYQFLHGFFIKLS